MNNLKTTLFRKSDPKYRYRTRDLLLITGTGKGVRDLLQAQPARFGCACFLQGSVVNRMNVAMCALHSRNNKRKKNICLVFPPYILLVHFPAFHTYIQNFRLFIQNASEILANLLVSNGLLYSHRYTRTRHNSSSSRDADHQSLDLSTKNPLQPLGTPCISIQWHLQHISSHQFLQGKCSESDVYKSIKKIALDQYFQKNQDTSACTITMSIKD